MAFIESNWLLLLIVVALAIAIAWYVFHAARRTRVTGDRRDVLDEGAAPAARNQALIDAPREAAPTVPVSSPPSRDTVAMGGAQEMPAGGPSLPTAGAAAGEDDLRRIKGVGPKLVAHLQTLGIASFAQIAGWSEADIDRIDAQLGRFQGRIRRDNWVEQARYLAAGDDAGFAARFGAIS